MREIFTYGSVGGAPGNRRFYPEPDLVTRCDLLCSSGTGGRVTRRVTANVKGYVMVTL